jgi:hypothetical protein
MKPLGILILLLLSTCGRQPTTNTHVSTPTPIPPQNRITIFFVDRSGSFHKIQNEGNFRGQDYFHIACEQIKQYVERPEEHQHELIIVRTIESASFSDETVAAQIDFTNINFEFQEPEPKGAYAKLEKEAWQKRKDKFLSKINDERASLLKSFSAKMDELENRGPSDRTDIVNAFKALLQDLKSLPHDPKRIIVYSDFKDNQNRLDSSEELDFGDDTEIEGRFVSINDLTPRKYDELIGAWERILKCKSKEFKTPIKSIE